MKRLARILAASFVALGAFAGLASPAYAIANPDAISIESYKVFQNVLETGDMLFVLYYNVGYTVEPTQEAGESFTFSVYDGATLKQSRALNYYQYNLISIYADAATVTAKYVWGTGYTLRIAGSPSLFGTITEGVNMASVTLTAGDYIPYLSISENQALIKAYLLDITEALENAWAVTLIITSPDGQCLNSTGRAVMLDAIKGVDTIAPGLFQLSSGQMPIEWDTHPGTLGSELTISSKLGASINTSLSGLGTFFGVSGQMVGGFFAIITVMFIFGIVFAYTGSTISGMILSVPIIIFASWAGLIPLYILYIATLLVVMYVFYHLWLQGAG